MKRMLILIAISAFSAVSGGASAQTVVVPGSTTSVVGGGARLERGLQLLQDRFASANDTHDGKLTRQQAAAGMPMVARHFSEIDTRRAGYVTLEQVEAYFAQKARSS